MATYQDIFLKDADPLGTSTQDAKHATALAHQQEALSLRHQAAINLHYAERIEQVGHSPYMAQIHRTCAAQKIAKAAALWPADDTAIYDSIGQVF